MGNASSKLAAVCGRCLKALIVALLLPLPIGLVSGVMDQLGAIRVSGATAREWVQWGCLAYVGFHIVLYRPAALFRASHQVFSTLAVWLFGGQVSTTEDPAGGKGKGAKRPKGDPGAQGSPLVAFSPYVVPVSTVLACAIAWMAAHRLDRKLIDAPASVLIGVTIAFHWLMTADALQPQRERWHVETYLLAVELVFLLTLVIGGACVWWALPEFSLYHALSDGWAGAVRIYQAATRALFF